MATVPQIATSRRVVARPWSARFDVPALRTWLAARVQAVNAESWSETGERLGRLGYWEFEDHRP